ncbi:MAG: hypothetical protein JWR75_2030 [Devosia sp.]|nr:hypothetical protein [Devosia sp.]
MREPVRTVVVIAANPALSSILAAMLATDPALRVRQFETLDAVRTYLYLAAVDLIVADFDCEEAPAAELTLALRGNPQLDHRQFEVIALAHAIKPATKLEALRAGIAEVIVKPMSPRYLRERVQARLRTRSNYQRPPTPRLGNEALQALIRGSDNVIPLFGRASDRPRHA